MRRRPTLAALLAIALLCAAPGALASPSTIRLEMPGGAFVGGSVVAVNVTLVIQDFMCHEPRDFVVFLSTNTTAGVVATFAKSNLTFTTPARAYFADTFSQTQTVNLSVSATQQGEADLTARFDGAEAGPCFAPDGFTPASTSVLVRVDAGSPAAPPPPTPPPPPAVNETNESASPPDEPPNGTGENESVQGGPASPPAPQAPVCSPDGNCGPIGDFQAQESAADAGNDAPGAGLVGAVAAIALGAFALRRRKS